MSTHAKHRANKELKAHRGGFGYRLRSWVLTVGAVMGTLCLVAAGASLAFDVRPAIVISGSMEPTIPTGALTFGKSVPAAEIEVGDVVTVPRPTGGLVTHRVVSVEQSKGTAALTLQGDANNTADALPYQVTEVRRVIASVPRLGGVVLGLRSPSGLVFCGALGVLFIVLFAWQPRGERSPDTREPEDIDQDIAVPDAPDIGAQAVTHGIPERPSVPVEKS